MSANAKVLAAALLFGGSMGCDVTELPEAPPAAPAPAVAAEPAAPPAGKDVTESGDEVMANKVPVTDIPRKFDAHDPVQGRRSRQVAQEGANPLGLGTTAAAGFFAKFQSMILAIDQANQLYWPQHDFSYPKTQEIFMDEVVKLALNGIPLPELPADQEYCYVPSQGEIGLQIRLKPGSPRSQVPVGTTPEDAIRLLGPATDDETATDATPSEATAGEPAAAATPEPESGRDEAGNPLDLRERAAALGGQAPEIEEP